MQCQSLFQVLTHCQNLTALVHPPETLHLLRVYSYYFGESHVLGADSMALEAETPCPCLLRTRGGILTKIRKFLFFFSELFDSYPFFLAFRIFSIFLFLYFSTTCGFFFLSPLWHCRHFQPQACYLLRNLGHQSTLFLQIFTSLFKFSFFL